MVPAGFLVTAGACGRFFASIGISAQARRLNEAGDGAVYLVCVLFLHALGKRKPGPTSIVK